MEELAMGNLRARQETGNLFFDFRYKGQRCREQTALSDTPANRKKLSKILERIDTEIALGTFDYERYFPQSLTVRQIREAEIQTSDIPAVPTFKEFTEVWLAEISIQWRPSHYKTVLITLRRYLYPAFGDKPLNAISKANLLSFRATLATAPGRKGRVGLSPSRVNHIMTPLRMILTEASDRFKFASPFQNIKSLKIPRTDVEPFTIEEVKLILDKVRPDFRNYYLVRFFTGMRPGEIDGLQWKYVDFERRQILIREAIVDGVLQYTKNDGAQREIDMSGPVYEVLRTQSDDTGQGQFVFCARNGSALGHKNITNRVWYPLLRHLGLRPRVPYQTRHTAATLWLASGESPEWIARQMGHTTTEMLFRVYSRFVPNLTRRDGSAFERLLTSSLST
jgi:integrase